MARSAVGSAGTRADYPTHPPSGRWSPSSPTSCGPGDAAGDKLMETVSRALGPEQQLRPVWRDGAGGPQPRTREGCRRHRAPGLPSHAVSARFTAPVLVEAGAPMSLIEPEPPKKPPSESSAAPGPLHSCPRGQKPRRSARGARRARELRKDGGQGARPAGGVWYVGRRRAREGEETGRARRPLAGRQGEFSGKAARAAAGRGCRGGGLLQRGALHVPYSNPGRQCDLRPNRGIAVFDACPLYVRCTSPNSPSNPKMIRYAATM